MLVFVLLVLFVLLDLVLLLVLVFFVVLVLLVVLPVFVLKSRLRSSESELSGRLASFREHFIFLTIYGCFTKMP